MSLMFLHVKDSRRILRPSLVLVLQERNVTTPSSDVRNKDRIFQGLKPYKTDLTVLQRQNVVVDDNVNNKNNNKNNNNNKITNPLLILQKACTMRGIADEQGYRLTGAPWGFSLAEIRQEIRNNNDHNNNNHNDPREVQQQQQQQQSPPRMFPSVRTIGFQRISEKGLDWLIKRPRSSSSSITATTSMTTMSNSTTNLLKPVALCYTEGIYPPTNPNDSCEQWRAEGQPIEIPVTEILDTVPLKSFAQILAVGRLEEQEEVAVAVKEEQLHYQERPLPPPPPPPPPQRPLSMRMKDREGFLALVAQVTQELYDNRVELKELEKTVQVLRLLPNRMELLVNGEQIWERFEWTRQKQQPKNNNNGWMQTHHQLLPY